MNTANLSLMNVLLINTSNFMIKNDSIIPIIKVKPHRICSEIPVKVSFVFPYTSSLN